ncbi:MAG: LacI family DNA-binding transcriptional regulator [Oscillospiraceae bacterium]|nr:LacI family DNA-binding transcriptional regulator [Oscillospiraceae bacterium]
MISIKDIALHCGVSTATVSKALNDQPDIGKGTRERVKAAAAELGYLPNAAARALRTKRSYSIGVLFVDQMQSGLAHEYFSVILNSLKTEAEKLGYDITFFSQNVGGRCMTYTEHCRYRNMDGVVIACVNFEDPEVLELVGSGIPTVTIDHIFNDKTAIISDNIGGMRELVLYIAGRGHHRIAYIHGEKTSVAQNRLLSFYKTCEELGIEVPEQYVLESRFHDPLMTAQCVDRLLNLKELPSCIILPDDYSYPAAINVAQDHGLEVPKDLSFAGYDGLDTFRMIQPTLVTYRQNAEKIGLSAAQQIVNLIEKPKTTLPQRIVITGRVLTGNSVKQL